MRLAPGFQALVFGSTGTLGRAFVEALQTHPGCQSVIGLSRQTTPGFDLRDESSIADCAAQLKVQVGQTPFHLIIDATGALQIEGQGPEKRLSHLNTEQLLAAFQINAVGPALLMKHFIDFLPRHERCIFATLSARVGSIEDNHTGGWYGYRASKAALNMLLRSAAIEASRHRPDAIFAALQPGTVASRLSAPFVPASQAQSAAKSVASMLATLDTLEAGGEAVFRDYRGAVVPW